MIIKDNRGNHYQNYGTETELRIPMENLPKEIEQLELCFDEFDAEVGEDGYYVIADVEKTGSQLCYFTKKSKGVHVHRQNLMPIFGVKKKDSCFLAIAEGMKNELSVKVTLDEKGYHISAVYDLEGDGAYEDLTMKMIFLEASAGYSEMAVFYRNYLLKEGKVKPISERIKENPYLAYAVEAPEIRIRMGWKPAPSKVLEQTPENEPEMITACTFERVADLIRELKKQGVDKAEICLVGWNISGHDGRYPQMFPVEERLGGENELRKLIGYAKKNGYQIVCHTNSTDAYSIANTFSEDIVRKNQDGSLCANAYVWSGGRAYDVCSAKAYEIAKEELPKVADLGFEGLHYIDVMSVEPLKKCYDPNHKVNRKDTEENYRKIGHLSKKLFGGFASEGANDFAADYLDYAFYVTLQENTHEFFDEEIPWWQLVYHGIVLSNPSTTTVNYVVKSKESHLKLVEYGARPSFYFYSKFMSGGTLDDWLGREDMLCDNEEQLVYSVSGIKKAYEEYQESKRLQLLFMNKHEKIREGVYRITYSDGTEIECDYHHKNIT